MIGDSTNDHVISDDKLFQVLAVVTSYSVNSERKCVECWWEKCKQLHL